MAMAQTTHDAQPDASRYLPLLLALFAGSGCSALIYETVWYQMLQLAIGSTAVSLGFLLATVMGGLCIGSLWLPSTHRFDGMHPLRVYAYLEFGIAATAVVVPLSSMRSKSTRLPGLTRESAVGSARRTGTILPGLHGRGGGTVSGQCGQATKGIRWMTWRTEAKKDGVASEMLRGVGKQAVIRRYLNRETDFTAA